jgi:hypothetical protein
MASTTITTLQAVKNALSSSRMGTYEAATSTIGQNDPKALELYAWNAQVSGAFLVPLHICEVVVRNAVSEALEAIYGQRWPWVQSFERSLSDSGVGYSPRKDLQNARRNIQTTGKLIPELKFVFWQKMFTSRHDVRIWDHHLLAVMPNLGQSKPINVLRQEVYQDLERIRILRNRIAHHEPIFTRNLTDDFLKIVNLVEFRCQLTADWMVNKQHASAIINARP